MTDYDSRAMADQLFRELVEIVIRLRGPDGCPWDREQTLPDLGRYIAEEAAEVVQAIESHQSTEGGDAEAVAEELGDVFFNILLAARIAEEAGQFDLERVLTGVRDKIVRRHPHVFGDAKADTMEEVYEHWNRVKAEEKRAKENG